MTREQNRTKKVAIWAITPGGVGLGERLFNGMDLADFFVSDKLSLTRELPTGARPFKSLSRALGEGFHAYSAHIFLFSTGIAVRMIAPLLRSKLEDPAVVVVDDRGLNAISLVSGHLGGANELALGVGKLVGARPVITTATDVNQLPSIDMVAKENGLLIENPEMIKTINMAFLQGRAVELQDPFDLVVPHLPERFVISRAAGPTGTRPAVVCTDRVVDLPRETLVLRPGTLAVGIGCNRGTAMEEIHGFLTNLFRDRGLSPGSIALLATTDVKADEAGLLALGEKLGLDIRFYDKPSLNSVTTIQNPSRVVEKHLGVKSVCEAAAILAANNGKLIVPKQKQGNVTLAVARKPAGYLSSGPVPGM
ncbi:MAG: cobalt-precorrin 5A hydrolase [Desulfobacteraceae bacterium]|nr:cobalt-precorrin 5A hydrolase [Desulfobacteraceae bacterium]